MSSSIRTATPDDYEEVLVHIDAGFGFEPGTFVRRYPHHWQPQWIDWPHIWVAEDEGRIAALVRIFPLQVFQSGAEFTVGGIGTVSTAPWARGRGHMTSLLKRTNEAMREEGHALSILWGDRHRYGEFGYETAGRVPVLSFSVRGFERVGVTSREPVAFTGQSDVLAQIEKFYQAQLYRRVRATGETALIFESPDYQAWVSSENGTSADFGYLVLSDNHVAEWGGNTETVLQMARWWCEQHQSEISFHFPNREAVAEPFLAAMQSWLIQPFAEMQVLNASALAQAYGIEKIAALENAHPREQTRALFAGLNDAPLNFFLPGTDGV